MPGLLNEMAHRPHGLLEVTQGDMCHVRATVLPPRINLPILQEFLKAFCRRGWPMVRCVGAHNRVPLTDELQDCHHGFFVQITSTRAIPTHAVDVTRWCSESGQLMHLDYQYYAGDSHQFLVGVAHGLTLLASSLAPCWGDRESWDEWLLMELRHRYLALCGLTVHLYTVHASINDLDACYDPGRTYMVAAPVRPPRISEEAVTVLYVRVRVDGFFDEGAVWCPAAIACFAMIEQLGLFVACQQRGGCRCYLNGTPLHNDLVAVTHGDFLAIFKSDHAHSEAPGHATLSIASNGRQGGYLGTVSECPAEQCSEAASESCSDAEHSVD